MTKKASQEITSKILSMVAIVVLVVFAVFPILWILLTSFKKDGDIISPTPKFVFQPTLEHWYQVLVESSFLDMYRNSLIITISTVVIVIIVATMAAYSLVRSTYRGKENIAHFILSQRMMPPVAVILPIFILVSQINMLDRLEPLILINIAFNLPLSIWMIRGFVEHLNIEIEEAAQVDGASKFGAFLRVGTPQMIPGLLSTALFVFIYTINEFFFAMILSGTHTRPVTIAVQLFLPTGVRGTLFGQAAVASILIILPSLIIAILMQRFLVAGISLGAVKG